MKVRKLKFINEIILNNSDIINIFNAFLFGKADNFVNFNYSGNQTKKIKLC